MSSKKSNKGTVVFIIVIILTVVIGAAQIFLNIKNKGSVDFKEFNSKSSNPIIKLEKNKSDVPFKNKKSAYIAKIVIEGTIQKANQTYNQNYLLKTIDGLKNDPNNKGIILFIDSPGGAVYESDELYLALMNYKKETERPVYAYLADMAASGGYYIACSADYIAANRNTLTGSIGVIAGQFVDLTGLMDKYGIKSTTIHAGRNKTMGSYSEPMTPEQQKIMQSIADECYDQFTGIVAESRKLPLSKVKTLADGRIYTAKQAILNGLIDNISDFDACVSAMKIKEFDDADYQVYTFQYERNQNFYEMLMGTAKDISKIKAGENSLPEALEKIISPELSYPAYYYSR